MENIDISLNFTYIFKGLKSSNEKDFLKFHIEEITKTSYLIRNMDNDSCFRVGKKEFENDYEPVEIIETAAENLRRFYRETRMKWVRS